MQPFLISFHTHFLTKTGKVRGWREGKDAFTQFSTGHPSLCCFCPRLTLYAVPFQPGAPHPHQTNLPIPHSEFVRAHLHTHTHAPLGTVPLVHRQPIGIQDWYRFSDRPLKGLKGHK